MSKIENGLRSNGAAAHALPSKNGLNGEQPAIEVQAGVHDGSTRKVIVLAERRTLLRECLARGLESLTNFRVVGVTSIRDWLEHNARPSASLVILSTHADADEQGLLQDTMALAQSGVNVPVVVMSDMDGLHQVLSVLKTGVRGYIPTSMPLSLALEALRLVCAGGTYIPAESVLAAGPSNGWQPIQQQQTSHGPFTTRQLQVVEALRRGKANKVIAYELNMCESTVKVHVRHIMKKLQARNRTEVAFKTNELLRTRETSLAS